MTRLLFQALSCTEYDAGGEGTVRLLFVDHAVDCNSDAYTLTRTYAVVMILILPVGLLLVARVGLWRLRQTLRDVDEADRDQHPLLKVSPLSPLFGDYKPPVAPWYDVADMGRRLVLTCVTVMLTDQASFFIVSLTAAIFAVVAHTEVRPLR